MSNGGYLWPQVRLRDVLSPQLTPERRQTLETATRVNFLPMEAIGEQGELDLTSIRAKEEVGSGYTLFFDGDVLVAKITPCFENGKGAIARKLLNGVGFGTTELHVLSASDHLDPAFLYYITVSYPFRALGEAYMTGAAGQKRVPAEFIENFRIGLPPLRTQRAIAAFLDRETAKIDAKIEAKQRLLALLAEKRQALITQVVTRGLDPSVPMKDSGVEWIGEVPKHWEAEEAGWLFREIDLRSTSGEEELLTVSHLTGVTRRSEKDVNMFMAESNEGYKLCQAGDLIINTLWAWMGAMGVAFEDGIVSPAYNVYRPNNGYDPQYIDLLVRIPIFAQEVTRYSKGVWSSRLRLYPDEFFQVVLPVPPLAEQQQIAEHVNKETRKIEQLSAVAQSTIEILQERRTALISEAVTGQLQVAE